DEGRKWLKTLAFPAPSAPSTAAGVGENVPGDTVEQTYTVEVSGKRFAVRVLGPPFSGGGAGGSNGAFAASVGRSSIAETPARAGRRAAGKSSSGGGPDTLASPLQGNMGKGLVKQGDTV